MKLKRAAIVFVALMVIVAIPIFATNISTGRQYQINYSVYGYGMLSVTDALGGGIASGTYLASGTRVNFRATEALETGHVFAGWMIDGVVYAGDRSLTHTFIAEQDIYVRAMFLDPTQDMPDYELENDSDGNNPGNGNNAGNDNNPGNGNNVGNGNNPGGNASGNNPESDISRFVVVLDPNGGTLPVGAQSVRTVPSNSVISTLPNPNRNGYVFSGWMLEEEFASTPLTVVNDFTLEASWLRLANPTAHNNNNDEYQFPDVELEEDQHVIAFNPAPGVFASGESGLRVGDYGTAITNMPQSPTHTGYNFAGWRLPNGNTLSGQLVIQESMTLRAIWNPTTSASLTSPTPASPTPRPGGSGARPNPQTSPLHISFMIFAMVMVAGIATFAILKLNQSHAKAEGQYRSDIARFNRERRLMDLMDKE